MYRSDGDDVDFNNDDDDKDDDNVVNYDYDDDEQQEEYEDGLLYPRLQILEQLCFQPGFKLIH